MRNKRVRKLVLAALFAALCCMMTMIVSIPAPTGYVNLGDCAVLLSGWVLGPVWGGAAAGIGSMLADVLNGWVSYAPATLIIKALMAVCAALIAQKIKGRFGMTIGALVSACVMALGYLVYESAILAYGAAALASVPANLIQGAVGAAAGVGVAWLLERSGVLTRIKQE